MKFAVTSPQSGSSSTDSRSNLVFAEGGKPENPEKNPHSKDENQQQSNSTHMTPRPGIEPRGHVMATWSLSNEKRA